MAGAPITPITPATPSATPARTSGLVSHQAREQYAALAWLQYRIFINSLRTRRGGVELGARILSFLVFTVIALGPAIGMGIGAWYLTSSRDMQGVAALLWILCLVWQGFSALAPALAGQNPELTHLLRYPVSFGSWVLLYLVHGLAAPSTLIGLLWTVAIAIGISVASPGYILWTALTLATFALFNLLLSRMVLAWVERWMAQRRTREIITAILLFAALAAQAFNPALHQGAAGLPFGLQRKAAVHLINRLWTVQKFLPPGLAYESIGKDMTGRRLIAAEFLACLGFYSLAAGLLLGFRLRAESRGESLSEVRPAAPSSAPASPARSRSAPGFDALFSGPLAAILGKDLRYILRSGPMLYNLAAPLVMAFLFSGTMRPGPYGEIRAHYALPLAMVWVFLGLTRIISNNLGADGDGLAFYFIAPTPMRTIVLGKNLLHLMLFVVEALLIAAMILFRFGAPEAPVVAATVAWLLFAVPANFAAGNLLSITMPYRMNLVRMRREEGALGNGLLSMMVQLFVLGLGAAVLAPCAATGHPWLATPILLLLAAAALGAYLTVLHNVNGMIEARKESLIGNIVKASPVG